MVIFSLVYTGEGIFQRKYKHLCSFSQVLLKIKSGNPQKLHHFLASSAGFDFSTVHGPCTKEIASFVEYCLERCFVSTLASVGEIHMESQLNGLFKQTTSGEMAQFFTHDTVVHFIGSMILEKFIRFLPKSSNNTPKINNNNISDFLPTKFTMSILCDHQRYAINSATEHDKNIENVVFTMANLSKASKITLKNFAENSQEQIIKYIVEFFVSMNRCI